VVKGYNPDFALMHVQRADKAGNGQLWGAMINSKWAALAAKKVILSCEEIVDTEVIMSIPTPYDCSGSQGLCSGGMSLGSSSLRNPWTL